MFPGSKASQLEFGLVFLSLTLWWVFPQLVWQPLILGVAIVLIRLFSRRGLLLTAYFNLAAGLWLVTAGVGAWASYNQAVGLKLLALTVGGVLLMYVLAGLARDDLGTAAGICAALSGLLAVYFLLTHDWQLVPADAAGLNRLGIAWMQIRPTLNGQRFHPNMVGGVLASLFPLALAIASQQRHQSPSWRLLAAGAVLLVMGTGLILTSSRAAWAILAAGLGVWWVLDRWNRRILPSQRRIWIFICLVAGIAVCAALAGIYSLEHNGIALTSMSGSLGSRLELFANSLQLSRDAIWTGYGLGSFPGLYSTYMLLIQVPLYYYSHNLYLDSLVEQGVFGLIGILGLLFGSIVALVLVLGKANENNRPVPPLALPVLIGLVIVLMHGLIDNPYAESWSRPLITLLPGFAAAVVFQEGGVSLTFPKKGAVVSIALVLAAAAAVLWPPLQADLLADITAVNMARVQLSGWPDHKAESADLTAALELVQSDLYKVLGRDSSNATAYFRLGLIEMQNRNFIAAAGHLQAAAQTRQNHRGIRKALGLALTWIGNEQEALALLSGLPEVVSEMQVYAWWWQEQDRPEFSLLAERMARRLSAEMPLAPSNLAPAPLEFQRP